MDFVVDNSIEGPYLLQSPSPVLQVNSHQGLISRPRSLSLLRKHENLDNNYPLDRFGTGFNHRNCSPLTSL